jgi:hypothetical protein
MCKCTPELRAPWCGKPGCEQPPQEVTETKIEARPAFCMVKIVNKAGARVDTRRYTDESGVERLDILISGKGASDG